MNYESLKNLFVAYARAVCKRYCSTCNRTVDREVNLDRACGKPVELRCSLCGSDDLMFFVQGEGPSWHVEDILRQLFDGIPVIDKGEIFDEYLYEVYSEPVTICGYEYDQAYAMKTLDPVTYGVMQSDYITGLDNDGEIVSFDLGSTYRWTKDLLSQVNEQAPHLLSEHGFDLEDAA